MSELVVVLVQDRERSVEWWPSSGEPMPASVAAVLARLDEHERRMGR